MTGVQTCALPILFFAVSIGLAVGLVIGRISEMFTSDHFRPVKEIAKQSETGPATVALAGIADGMRSAAFSVIVVAAGIGGSYWAGELAFDDGGSPCWNSVTWVVSRKNGKTNLLAAYAVYRLITSEDMPEIRDWTWRRGDG